MMNVRRSIWVPAVSISVLNVLVASGFSLAGVIRPMLVLQAGAHPGYASSVFAYYALARTIAVAIAVLVAAGLRKPSALLTLGLLAGGIQGLDAVIGVWEGDPGKTFGPLVICLLQFWVMQRLYSACRKTAN